MSLAELKKLTKEYSKCSKKFEAQLKALPTQKKRPKGTVMSKKSKELLAKTLKKLEKLKKTQVEGNKSLQKSCNEAITSVKSTIQMVDKNLSENVKAYQQIIKNSDGITTMRPVIVKALEAAKKTKDRKFLDASIAALGKQADDIKKEAAKEKDKEKMKKRIEIIKGLGALEKKLAAL